jgi:hypothetical protein
MLFAKRFWDGIADGSITLTFRRWKRPQVVAGRPYRTPAGRIEVTAIDEVDPATITTRDARRAGFAGADSLREELRGDHSSATYRIAFRFLDEPDPRAELAASNELDAAQVEHIRQRLDRLDRASSHGPWTRETLGLIESRPQVRAPDLAASVGRETAPFKLDVRKLKALGLTISHPVGYELSPRGRAFRRAEASVATTPPRAETERRP